MTLSLSLFSTALYLITAFILLRSLHSGGGRLPKAALLLWLAAILIHSAALIPEIIVERGVDLSLFIDLSLFNASSLLALLISLILLITCLRQPLAAMGIIILPLAAICVALTSIETANSITGRATSLGIQFHIISSLLAYSLLVLAGIQALVINRQIRYLKIRNHSNYKLVATLPTLDATESFLFTLVKFGILLLTISLITGWIYHQDLFAQHLVHKTVLSVMAWIVFSIVLVGKWLSGWRTKTAVNLILVATVFLVLAYLGSKFVLEVVLDRI